MSFSYGIGLARIVPGDHCPDQVTAAPSDLVLPYVRADHPRTTWLREAFGEPGVDLYTEEEPTTAATVVGAGDGWCGVVSPGCGIPARSRRRRSRSPGGPWGAWRST